MLLWRRCLLLLKCNYDRNFKLDDHSFSANFNAQTLLFRTLRGLYTIFPSQTLDALMKNHKYCNRIAFAIFIESHAQFTSTDCDNETKISVSKKSISVWSWARNSYDNEQERKHLGNIISPWKEICNLCNFMLPFLRAQDPQTTFNFHICDDDDDEKSNQNSFFGPQINQQFTSDVRFSWAPKCSHADTKIKKII